MVKRYQMVKWKKHQRHIQLVALKKVRKRAKAKGLYSQKAKRINRNANPTYVKAPEVFSLLRNTEEMLKFFDKLHGHALRKEAVKLDLSWVNTITYDAILYTLSVIEYFDAKYHPFVIVGNQPTDPACAKVFNESGFYKFVKTRVLTQPNIDVLSIEAGEINDGEIAAKVKKFAEDHLKASENQSLKAQNLYETLIECMGNTVSHAYSFNDKRLKSKWWIICYFDQTDQKVHFTFLDNGLGIPSTVRRKWTELLSPDSSDGKVIISALKGDFRRTETNQPHRGLGLPEIYNNQNEKQIEDLIIISNRAFVDVGAVESTSLENKFHGTLLSWSFR